MKERENIRKIKKANRKKIKRQKKRTNKSVQFTVYNKLVRVRVNLMHAHSVVGRNTSITFVRPNRL